MDSLCKYKDIFGAPGTGLHKYRFLGMAVVDWIFTIIGVLLVALVVAYNYSTYFSKNKYANFFSFFGIIFALTVILFITMHKLFCVNTALNKMLGIA
jgi:hypothetical protein